MTRTPTKAPQIKRLLITPPCRTTTTGPEPRCLGGRAQVKIPHGGSSAACEDGSWPASCGVSGKARSDSFHVANEPSRIAPLERLALPPPHPGRRPAHQAARPVPRAPPPGGAAHPPPRPTSPPHT